MVERLGVSLSCCGVPEQLGESVGLCGCLGILQQLVEGMRGELGLVVLHVRCQCRCCVVASVAHGTLVWLLSVMGLLVDFEVIAPGERSLAVATLVFLVARV